MAKRKQTAKMKAAEAKGGRMANVEEGHRRSMKSGAKKAGRKK